MSVRQAMEKMEYHRYQCLPVLNADGEYSGVVTEGDLLWAIKNHNEFSLQDAEKMPLSDVPRHFVYDAIPVDTDMDSVINTAYRQSFVPVTDDTGAFIGIIRRADIIHYIYSRYTKLENEKEKASKSLAQRLSEVKAFI